jgi:hypothetical protein
MQEIKRKNIKRLGLDKFVSRSGFIEFTKYHNKLKMMDTDLFLFGMKLHKQ